MKKILTAVLLLTIGTSTPAAAKCTSFVSFLLEPGNGPGTLLLAPFVLVDNIVSDDCKLTGPRTSSTKRQHKLGFDYAGTTFQPKPEPIRRVKLKEPARSFEIPPGYGRRGN